MQDVSGKSNIRSGKSDKATKPSQSFPSMTAARIDCHYMSTLAHNNIMKGTCKNNEDAANRSASPSSEDGNMQSKVSLFFGRMQGVSSQSGHKLPYHTLCNLFSDNTDLSHHLS